MDIYEKYVDVSKQIVDLEFKQEALRHQISLELPPEGIKNDKVVAIWKNIKKYKYSPVVDSLTENLKNTKKLEEESGVATFEESKQLSIKVK